MLERSSVFLFYFRPLGGSAALQEAEYVMKFRQTNRYFMHLQEEIATP